MNDSNQSTKEKILWAANHVVTHKGVKSLTLETVAKQAGLSKGGLLYHFPTKEALVEEMVTQNITLFNNHVLHSLDLTDDTPGQLLRATIRVIAKIDEESLHVGTNILAAAATDTKLLEPLRENYQQWQAQIENDWLDPALASVIRLALDGLWFAEIFDLAPPRGLLRQAIFRQLIELSKGEVDMLTDEEMIASSD